MDGQTDGHTDIYFKVGISDCVKHMVGEHTGWDFMHTIGNISIKYKL